MRSGLSPARAASAWRLRNSARSDSRRPRQSAVCMPLHKVNLVNYVSSVPVSAAGWQARRSTVFEDQSEFGACGDPVSGELLVFWPHLVLLECGVAGVVDREQVWVDGIALGMAHALRLLEPNLHTTSFSTAPVTHGLVQAVKHKAKALTNSGSGRTISFLTLLSCDLVGIYAVSVHIQS